MLIKLSKVGNPLRIFRDPNSFLVTEFQRAASQLELVDDVDKLFDGIRWITTRIYRAIVTLINGFGWLARLKMLFVVAFFQGLWEIIRAIGRWPQFFINAWHMR